MIVSMTGFASATREDGAASVTVTLKSVNHRFLDLQVRAPSGLAGAEAALRAVLQKHVSRGRVDASVHVQYRAYPFVRVVYDHLARRVLGAGALFRGEGKSRWLHGQGS